jgi:mannose-1-phosphate guanylyltransferase
MSRNAFPKQFHDVLGTGDTLIQQTYQRAARFISPQNILVVTNGQYLELIRKQLPDLPTQNILLEPYARNTAPCVAYALFKVLNRNPLGQLLILPSDQYIQNEELYQLTLQKSLVEARTGGKIITIGITPTRPDTGYGYIQFIPSEPPTDFMKVRTFTEKPTLEVAKHFIASGDFVWNSGVFVASGQTLADAYRRHLPDMFEQFSGITAGLDTPQEIETLIPVYETCQQISIDHGIMEKYDNVFVIPGTFGWSDLGTWKSLYERVHKDDEANSQTPNTRFYHSHGNLVKCVNSAQGKLVILHGVDNLIVVDNGETLLICNMDDEQEIKEIVLDLKKDKLNRYV